MRVLIVLALAAVSAACGLFDREGSPTAPTPAPPAPDAAVRYAAMGASDAVGVGGSVVCVPFTACEGGTGYVPVLVRQLRTTREVTLANLGIPGAVLSPSIQAVARQHGRDVIANFIDREMPFVPVESTLVTIFGGGNDVNALADAIDRGAAGSDVRGYVDAQVRAFGGDFDRLMRGVRDRAPAAYIVVLNLPNLAMLPYATRYADERRRVMQAISVGFSREANRQAGGGAVVVDLMCDPRAYEPSRFSSDGFHPNDAGYATLAEKILQALNGAAPAPPTTCGPMQALPPL